MSAYDLGILYYIIISVGYEFHFLKSTALMLPPLKGTRGELFTPLEQELHQAFAEADR